MAKKTRKKWLWLLPLLLLCALAYTAYKTVLQPNTYLDGKKYKFIYIPTKSTYADVLSLLKEEDILQNPQTFEWLAKAYDLSNTYKPGKYRVTAGMTNRQIIRMIKNGKQEKVKITFNASDHTNEDLIQKIADKLEISESELETFFSTPTSFSERYQTNTETLRCLFLPETYELNWNTPLPDLMLLVEKKYNTFWNDSRKKKAGTLNFSPLQVIILASIVQSESSIASEQQLIAGVYINRLNQNMPLQADPTLIFAVGDFSIQRVRSGDKEINSPYNTYQNKGLPPGPICLPYAQAMDAVLNYKKHHYLYFCAKPDLKGYSNYSVTYQEHQKYAEAYQKEMNKRGINR
ncbi:MAG: endolytic transglycosylase MltG [Bacteroidetes bacterium]|nr:endolytic transglycosylase MltG [Bacteroidota bacterium]